MAKKGGAPTKSEVLTHISKDTGLSRKQVGSVFDSSSNSYATLPGTTLGDRTPAFSQLDLRVDKTWTTPTAR